MGEQRTALVVNCSAPKYSLGAAKLADCLTDDSNGWPHGLTSTETVGLP